MIIVEFFRDVLDGIWYWLYLLLCIIFFFFVLGIVADNKREKINKKLKEKKSYDIESGKEAAIAALESKQVLAVNEEDKQEQSQKVEASIEVKDDKPAVVVIGSTPSVQNTTPNQTTTSVENPIENSTEPVVSPNMTPMEQARSEEPLVINSN